MYKKTKKQNKTKNIFDLLLAHKLNDVLMQAVSKVILPSCFNHTVEVEIFAFIFVLFAHF